MKICAYNNIVFQRKLRPDEESEFSNVLKRGKEKLGNTGHSILIVPSSSLPQSVKTNTGVGNLLDEEAIKFFDFAKQYWGINTIQLLPIGEHKQAPKGSFKPYSGSTFSLGTQVINLDLLTGPDFAQILSQEDLQKVVTSNNERMDRVNFENVLNKESSAKKALKKALENLKKADTPTKKHLLEEFELYRQENKTWLEPKVIFDALSEKYGHSNPYGWNEFDKNFYNEDVVSISDRENAIKGLRRSKHCVNSEFIEFEQFIADKHLALAKENLNKKGIKLSGDVLLNFSKDEIWANPKAFIRGSSLGWGIEPLNLEAIEGRNLLRAKINKFAQRYDAIRIDASWSYSTQTLKDHDNNPISRKIYRDSILNIIDDEFKKVKGDSFKSEDIMHEFLAKLEDFDIYENGELKSYVKDRVKINTSRSMHDNWGSVANYRDRRWNPNSYVLGTTNHDCPSMRIEFADSKAREVQTDVLSRILKIPKEKLATLNEFINAKFAEPMRAKHNMVFFSDALSLEPSYKENVSETEAYRLRIKTNYQDDFFKSLEKNEGFNVMDALEKSFVAEGLNEKEPDLFEKIVKYRKILQGKEDAIENSMNKKSNTKMKLIYVAIAGIAALAGYYIFSNKKGSSN